MKSVVIAAFLLPAIPRLDTGWKYAVTNPRATPPDERTAWREDVVRNSADVVGAVRDWRVDDEEADDLTIVTMDVI